MTANYELILKPPTLFFNKTVDLDFSRQFRNYRIAPLILSDKLWSHKSMEDDFSAMKKMVLVR
jgi:hypothetical protein